MENQSLFLLPISICFCFACFANKRIAITMLAFFFSSSKLSHRAGESPANRNYKQVFCNSFVGTLFGVMYCHSLNTMDAPPFLSSPWTSTFYLGGFLAFYACTTADTWASEIGVGSASPPRLITNPWRIVPKGTNGGVTTTGLVASIVGGLFIGVVFYTSTSTLTADMKEEIIKNASAEGETLELIESSASQLWMIAISTFCGLFGSLLDSLLGATLQFSGVSMDHRDVIFEDPNKAKNMKRISGSHILSNDGVNFVSTMITCFLGGCISVYVFC